MGVLDTLGDAFKSLMTSDYPMEQDLRSVQLGLPPPEGPVTRRPSVLPLTRDPSGKMILAMPKIADILGDMMGGGPGGTVNAGMRVPWKKHPISDIQMSKPVSEMERSLVHAEPALSKEKLISPEDLQGSLLAPLLGDRTARGGAVSHIGGQRLAEPTQLHGGHGFIADAPEGMVWASNPGPITGLSKKIAAASEREQMPVHGVYAAMGPQGADFSKQVAHPLVQMVREAPITRAGASSFDEALRAGNESVQAVPDFPGVRHPDLLNWMMQQDAGVRRRSFAQMMDRRKFADQGFPSVGEVRHAVTDPRLLDVNLGDAGLSVGRFDPGAPTGVSSHPDYGAGLKGEYAGGLGMSMPFNVLFPDVAKAYAQNYPKSRFDYLLQRRADPFFQKADQQWVDSVMPYWEAGTKR